jgi:hypothetical protein
VGRISPPKASWLGLKNKLHLPPASNTQQGGGVTSTQGFDPKEDPEVTKHNASFSQQDTQAGKNGRVHKKVNHNLGVAHVIEGYRHSGLSGINDPRSLIWKANALIHKAHTREAAVAFPALSGKKCGDGGDLRSGYKPKVEGTAQAGTVLLGVHCTWRY